MTMDYGNEMHKKISFDIGTISTLHTFANCFIIIGIRFAVFGSKDNLSDATERSCCSKFKGMQFATAAEGAVIAIYTNQNLHTRTTSVEYMQIVFNENIHVYHSLRASAN